MRNKKDTRFFFFYQRKLQFKVLSKIPWQFDTHHSSAAFASLPRTIARHSICARSHPINFQFRTKLLRKTGTRSHFAVVCVRFYGGCVRAVMLAAWRCVRVCERAAEGRKCSTENSRHCVYQIVWSEYILFFVCSLFTWMLIVWWAPQTDGYIRAGQRGNGGATTATDKQISADSNCCILIACFNCILLFTVEFEISKQHVCVSFRRCFDVFHRIWQRSKNSIFSRRKCRTSNEKKRWCEKFDIVRPWQLWPFIEFIDIANSDFSSFSPDTRLLVIHVTLRFRPRKSFICVTRLLSTICRHVNRWATAMACRPSARVFASKLQGSRDKCWMLMFRSHHQQMPVNKLLCAKRSPEACAVWPERIRLTKLRREKNEEQLPNWPVPTGPSHDCTLHELNISTRGLLGICDESAYHLGETHYLRFACAPFLFV